MLLADNTRDSSARSCVYTAYKEIELEPFLATNAEPKNHVATLAENHMEKLFQKVIKQQAKQKW